MEHPTTLIIGAHGLSAGAMANRVGQTQLQAAWPELKCDLRLFQTAGDKSNYPLPEIGGKGLFTEEFKRTALRRD
jgi:porphobilinogen deaminase